MDVLPGIIVIVIVTGVVGAGSRPFRRRDMRLPFGLQHGTGAGRLDRRPLEERPASWCGWWLWVVVGILWGASRNTTGRPREITYVMLFCAMVPLGCGCEDDKGCYRTLNYILTRLLVIYRTRSDFDLQTDSCEFAVFGAIYAFGFLL